MVCYCSFTLTFLWQPCIDRHFFQIMENHFKMKKNYFSYVTFAILSHVRVPLLVLITFCLILALS